MTLTKHELAAAMVRDRIGDGALPPGAQRRR
jgi:hypothetical protein